MLYLSDVPFAQLGFPTLGERTVSALCGDGYAAYAGCSCHGGNRWPRVCT